MKSFIKLLSDDYQVKLVRVRQANIRNHGMKLSHESVIFNYGVPDVQMQTS